MTGQGPLGWGSLGNGFFPAEPPFFGPPPLGFLYLTIGNAPREKEERGEEREGREEKKERKKRGEKKRVLTLDLARASKIRETYSYIA